MDVRTRVRDSETDEMTNRPQSGSPISDDNEARYASSKPAERSQTQRRSAHAQQLRESRPSSQGPQISALNGESRESTKRRAGICRRIHYSPSVGDNRSVPRIGSSPPRTGVGSTLCNSLIHRISINAPPGARPRGGLMFRDCGN